MARERPGTRQCGSDWTKAHSAWLAESRLEAAHIPLIINEHLDVDVAKARQVRVERVDLPSTEFKQDRAAAPQEAGAVTQDAAKDRGAIPAAVTSTRSPEGVVPISVHSENPLSPHTQWRSSP